MFKEGRVGVGSGWRGNLGFSLEATLPHLLDQDGDDDGDDDDDDDSGGDGDSDGDDDYDSQIS